MSDFDGPRLHRDDPLTRALRDLYAPPADPAYWDGLAARIAARVAADEDTWWALPRPVVRVGMLAAGVVLAVAAALLLRHQAVDAQLAIEAVDEVPAEQATIAVRDADSPRDASLRYVNGR